MLRYRTKIATSYELFAKRSTDFTWMIKVDGTWREVQDKDIVYVKVEM